MSQRTRNRTTAAAARKRQPTSATAADSSGSPSPSTGGEDASLSPQTLARTLRAVAAELERDPALAHRVASAIAADTPTSMPAPRTRSAEASSAPSDAAPASSTPPTRARQRAARAFTPSLVTGISPDFGPGIPDPFALARRLGPDGLRAALAGLRRGTLRAIIREHGIAPAAQVARLSDDARLREMILDAALK